MHLYINIRDMPPTGGFEAVKFKRNLPFRGPSGAVILAGVTGICVYGFYRLGKGNLERRYVSFPQTPRIPPTPPLARYPTLFSFLERDCDPGQADDKTW